MQLVADVLIAGLIVGCAWWLRRQQKADALRALAQGCPFSDIAGKFSELDARIGALDGKANEALETAERAGRAADERREAESLDNRARTAADVSRHVGRQRF